MTSTASSPGPKSERVWDEFLLLISPREEARAVAQREADSKGWTLYRCGTVAEGMEYLREVRFWGVICDEKLPDGDWTSLAAQTEKLPYKPRLVVIPGAELPRLREAA